MSLIRYFSDTEGADIDATATPVRCVAEWRAKLAPSRPALRLDWSLKTRLILLAGSALTAVALLAGQVVFSSQTSAEGLQSVSSNLGLVRTMAEVDQLHDEIHADLLSARVAALEHDAEALNSAADALNRHATRFLGLQKQMLSSDLPRPTLERMQTAAEAGEDYVASARLALGVLHDASLTAKDQRDAQEALGRLFFQVAEELQAATLAVNQDAKRASAEAERTQGLLLRAGIVSALGVGALLAVLTIAIARSILTPVQRLISATAALNSGDTDLTSRLPHAAGELGTLSAEFNAFIERLSTLVGDIQQASNEIQAGSAQIASGNSDLQDRTERSASSLQETAASAEQINATIQQTADAARQASGMVAQASEAAQRGGETVGRVIHTMEDISQASSRIADIVSVIDGIAFQTNILALNAAVEAARAGSQGKGFAVVAAEVRQLAMRSGQAAREISGLIKDSVDKVSSGCERVREAGQSMDDIVHSVQRVSAMMSEITDAAAEQSAGMHHVTAAVADLDRVTQQNAALVEQSAAAAQTLKDRAQRLSAAVGGYKLTNPRA